MTGQYMEHDEAIYNTICMFLWHAEENHDPHLPYDSGPHPYK